MIYAKSRPNGKRAGSSAHGERGAAMVEFALILPLLVLLTFGIIEFGVAFNTDSNVAQSARAGGRTAAILSTDPEMAYKVGAAAAASLDISPGTIMGSPTVCVGEFNPSNPNACDQFGTNMTLVHPGLPGSPAWEIQIGGLAPGEIPTTPDGWPVNERNYGCQSNPDPGTFDRVVVHVSIQHKLLVPGLFSNFFGGTSTPTISSTAVFQLEPVPNASC